MAHSFEVRPVMLEHILVEHVLSVQSSIQRQKKKLLLDATSECMPHSLYSDLMERPKCTFTFPSSRISEDLLGTIQETFGQDRLGAAGMLNPEAVKKLWARYFENPAAVGWSRPRTIFVQAPWYEIMPTVVWR
jgi:hypothetical protein